MSKQDSMVNWSYFWCNLGPSQASEANNTPGWVISMYSPPGTILSETSDLPYLIWKVLCLQNIWISQRLPDAEDISEMSWGTRKTLLLPQIPPMGVPSHVVLKITRQSGPQYRNAQRKKSLHLNYLIYRNLSYSEMDNT